jgi:hypothetical protein
MARRGGWRLTDQCLTFLLMGFLYRKGQVFLLLALQAAAGNAHTLHHVADSKRAHETCTCTAHVHCRAPDTPHAHSDGTLPHEDGHQCQICDVTEAVATHPSQRSSPPESLIAPQSDNLLLGELEASPRTEATPLVKPPPARLHAITLPMLN